MFREFFGLQVRPFGKTPNPAFLYESGQHSEALARLEFAVDEKELALLVGDVGSGKTTLSRALIDRVGDSRPVVRGSRPSAHRVVVGAQDDGRPAGLAGHAGHHVAERRMAAG